MRVLITRPGDDSASLADALRRIGIEPVFEPLLTIRFFDGPPLDLAGIQAILLTSANGARAIARRTERRDLPVYAVGDATARTARELGFGEVHSASGDVDALASLARTRLDPAQGTLLHAAASEVAGDLGSRLSEAGFTFRREVLYEAEAAHSLTPSAVAAIKEGRLAAATVFSPRTGETLARLIRKARLVRDCRAIELLCLSPAVADAAGDIPWKAVRIAEEPTEDSLVALAGTLANTAPAANANTGDAAGSGSVPPPPASRPVRAVLLTLLVVAALAGIAVATESLWRPPLARYVPILASDETVAQARIDELTRRLAALESKPAPAPLPAPISPDVTALQAERDRLQARLADAVARLDKLEAALDSKPSAPAPDPEAALRIERLARQVDALEKSVPTRDDAETVRQARLVFAIGRLRDSVQAARPFPVELAALKALAGGDTGIQEALTRLAPYADAGVPSLESLRQRFRTVARETVNATRLPDGDGWLERSLARILRSVSIRRTDNVEGGDAEAVVARAEQALARGDVRQAAVELQQLSEPVAAARTWLADADAFVVANRALVDLQTQAFVALGVPGPR